MYCPIKNGFRTIHAIIGITSFNTIAYIRSIVAIVLIPVPTFCH